MDRILVHDGPNDQSMLIGEIFGTQRHKVVKSISSSGESMFIDFQPHSYYSDAEFVAFIKNNKINHDCQSWLDNNVLMSPNYPNINCSWTITRIFGSYITLDFIFIEVKPLNITAKMCMIIKITILENSLSMDRII